MDKDLGPKKELYQRAGVLEYIVWQEFEHRIDWFGLADGEYVLRVPDDSGRIESAAFPAFILDIEAALEFDGAAMIAAL